MKQPSKPKAANKKAYRSPKLTQYGSVRLLTQAASTGSSEGSLGSGIMKPASDRTIKQNIIRIGEHPLGIGLYLFDYKPEYREEWGTGRQFGVMADEVETVMPEAVFVSENGYKRVDHRMLGIVRNIQ